MDHSWGLAVAAGGGHGLLAALSSQPRGIVPPGPFLNLQLERGCNVTRALDGGPCPASCQFLEPEEKNEFCTFRCVPAGHCGSKGGLLSFADEDTHLCMRCPVRGCRKCPTAESCQLCFNDWAYEFHEGHQACRLKGLYSFFGSALIIFLALPVAVIVAWYVSLRCRTVTNGEVLARAAIHSDRMKLRDHRRQSHTWYPLWKNLLVPDERGNIIGGPGLLLFFRFQGASFVWTIFALVAWVVVCFTRPELNWTEVEHIQDPLHVYDMCNATDPHNRIDEERAILWYAVTLYVVTTLGSLVFASWQRSSFCKHAVNDVSMQDYALFLAGFPQETGRHVEEERAEFVRQAVGRELIGVSVCWDFSHEAKEVEMLVRQDMWMRQRAQSRDSIRAADLRSLRAKWDRRGSTYEPPAEMPGTIRGRWAAGCQLLMRHLKKLDKLFSSLGAGIADAMHPADVEDEALRVIAELYTTEHLCVVFRTAQDRNYALDCFSQGDTSVIFKDGHHIKASGFELDAEPDTVKWSDLGLDNTRRRHTLVLSLLKILVAIVLWATFLYMPWGYYVAYNLESFGQLPTYSAEGVFSLLVVLGNQLVYLLCQRAAESVAFTHTGERDALYMLLYSIAILVNVAVDMFVLRWTSLKALNQFDMKFPSESLQEFMSYRLWKYNFPSCFMLPFVVEPLFTYVLPVDLASRLIGTRNVDQTEADEMLHPLPMDLSRYQDILLNMTQAILALFWEPAYVMKTLAGLLLGQVVIYCWDHYKVLRVVRNFNYPSFLSERIAQRLTAGPCALLGGCVVYRFMRLRQLVSEEEGIDFDIAVEENVFPLRRLWCILVVLVLHITVHLIVLQRVVPALFGEDIVGQHAVPYKETAQERPANYFNTNPVHCLRSRFLHKHTPSCTYYTHGKEHLLQANPAMGQYYQARRWDDKRKTLTIEMTTATRTFRKSLCPPPELQLGITSGRLWKLQRSLTQLFLSDDQLPHLFNGVSWNSLQSWRWRYFTLHAEREGRAELVYCSEKEDVEVVACVLSRSDASLSVDILPNVVVEPLSPCSQRLYRERLQSYETAFSMGPRRTVNPIDTMELPTTLYTLAIRWTDPEGLPRMLIVGHEQEKRCQDWAQQLRLFCRPEHTAR